MIWYDFLSISNTSTQDLNRNTIVWKICLLNRSYCCFYIMIIVVNFGFFLINQRKHKRNFWQFWQLLYHSFWNWHPPLKVNGCETTPLTLKRCLYISKCLSRSAVFYILCNLLFDHFFFLLLTDFVFSIGFATINPRTIALTKSEVYGDQILKTIWLC